MMHRLLFLSGAAQNSSDGNNDDDTHAGLFPQAFTHKTREKAQTRAGTVAGANNGAR